MTTSSGTPRVDRQFRRLVVLLAAIAVGMPNVSAERRLATISRDANQCDEYLIRGDAAVTPSPVFNHGLRLAAWDGADVNDPTRVALASAIYFIPLPAGTRGVRVTVSYRRGGGATRPEAGFLFIRDPQVEQAYDQPDGMPPDSPLAADPVFYGRTSPLPGTATQAQLVIGTDGLISEQGVLELHLATGAGQVMEADYLQVTAYADYQLSTEQLSQQVVIEQPYVYSYSYYYAGPWMSWTPAACTYYTFRYPTTPPFCFGGWWVWRSCYWHQHPWVCRPGSFTHGAPWPGLGMPYAADARNGSGVRAYRQQWYQHHFRLDAAKAPPEQLYRDVRHRRQTLPPDRGTALVHQAAAVSQHVTEADRELRKELGDQLPQRAASWRTQPRLARQDMQKMQVKSAAFRQAMQNVAAPGSAPAPATMVKATTPATVHQPGSSTQGGIIPAVKTSKTADAQHLRTITAATGSIQPANIKSTQHSAATVTVPTPPAAIREPSRQSVKPELPNNLPHTPRQLPGGGTTTGKSTDTTHHPAWPATPDAFSNPTSQHR
ncbi:MAG: hypothetical protein WCH61_01635 [bacterium]